MYGLSVSGIIPVNKPAGISSAAVVGAVKRAIYSACNEKVKVGHMGTLDPMAQGVLLIGVGKATRLFDILSSSKKGYIARFELGRDSDTLDITGTIICDDVKKPILSEIKKGITANIGEIRQQPPKYSAKSIDGVKAYKLMRQGKEVELKPNAVKIYDISLLSINDREDISAVSDYEICDNFAIRVDCGSGTYIRSVGRDIAQHAASSAVMTDLTRIYSGIFSLDNCFDFETVKNQPLSCITPMMSVVGKYLNVYELPEDLRHKFTNGIAVNLDINDSQCGISIDKKLYCIAHKIGDKYKSVINLWE